MNNNEITNDKFCVGKVVYNSNSSQCKIAIIHHYQNKQYHCIGLDGIVRKWDLYNKGGILKLIFASDYASRLIYKLYAILGGDLYSEFYKFYNSNISLCNIKDEKDFDNMIIAFNEYIDGKNELFKNNIDHYKSLNGKMVFQYMNDPTRTSIDKDDLIFYSFYTIDKIIQIRSELPKYFNENYVSEFKSYKEFTNTIKGVYGGSGCTLAMLSTTNAKINKAHPFICVKVKNLTSINNNNGINIYPYFLMSNCSTTIFNRLMKLSGRSFTFFRMIDDFEKNIHKYLCEYINIFKKYNCENQILHFYNILNDTNLQIYLKILGEIYYNVEL